MKSVSIAMDLHVAWREVRRTKASADMIFEPLLNVPHVIVGGFLL